MAKGHNKTPKVVFVKRPPVFIELTLKNTQHIGFPQKLAVKSSLWWKFH